MNTAKGKYAVALGGLLLLLASRAQAQRQYNNPADVRTELQVEFARQSGDYFWGSFRAEHIPEYSSFFEYNRLQGGYEHFWSPKWSFGGNARLYFRQTYRWEGGIVPELLLRHRGDVFGLTFGQRLSAELDVPLNNQVIGADVARNIGTARLRLDLERFVGVGSKVKLRPRIAYEASAHIRIQPKEDTPDERTLEQSVWRAEVGVRLSDHFDLTPYVARQMDYRLFITQFDADGNPVAGGRTNVRTPIIGLDLRYTLFQGKSTFERIQLPTQH